MPNNPSGAVDVPLSLFAGLNTELAPSDIPEGVSPDNGDVVFLPGSVGSREGLHRIFGAGFLPNGASVVFQKSFVQESGDPITLIFDSLGNVWTEDVFKSPGVYTKLASTAAARCFSTSAFGREYFAFSDGVNGADIPRQFDGQFFDRVSQDGPGAGPSPSNYIAPPTTLGAAGTTSPPVAVTSITPTDPQTTYIPNPVHNGLPGTYITIWTTLTIVCGAASGVALGNLISVTGNTLYNPTGTVTAIISGTTFKIGVGSGVSLVGAGGEMTMSTAPPSLVRLANVVTASTASAHGLQPGWQFQLTGVANTALGGGIVNMVIDNEVQPGVATITTLQNHGLSPNAVIQIKGMANGTPVNISAISVTNGIVFVTTSAAHGLLAGSSATIAGVTDPTYDGTYTVLTAPSSTTFTYAAEPADASSTGGTVSYQNPLNLNNSVDAQQQLETVQTVPTPTTFTIALLYSDGTWTGGNVYDIWNGTFVVATVPNPTTFTYSNVGPNDQTNSTGTVTPYGQLSPGTHGVSVCFITRQGSITAPSPPVWFDANGGSYLFLQNLAIGPANVVGRLILLTGAGGANFFAVPVTPQAQGFPTGNSTLVNDNVSTSVIIDIGDDDIFSAEAVDIPGNNLFAQVVLGPCLGVASYASRLFWWGERNKVQNLLNMGFDGGIYEGTPNVPLGWTVNGAGGTLVTTGPWGLSWQLAAGATAVLSQPCYQDWEGEPVLAASTTFAFRLWAKVSAASGAGNIVATINSPSQGILAQAFLPVAGMSTKGGFVQATFNAETPSVMPPDAVLQIQAQGNTVTLTIDEMEVLYTETPYFLPSRASYVNNPEAFDGETGVFGPSSDPTPIVGFSFLRDDIYIHTGSRYHGSADSPGIEPSDWNIRQIALNCGADSPWSIIGANDPAAAGESWTMWKSGAFVRIAEGTVPHKISREIQTLWNNENAAAKATSWACYDNTVGRIYFGVPTGTSTAPNMMYVLDVRELDEGANIASSPPVHISFTGKMIASDLTRKWSPWNLPMASGAMLQRPLTTGDNEVAPRMCLGGSLGYGQIYTLDPTKLTDDDYGQIHSYYSTYFMVSHESEQQLQLGSLRKLFQKLWLFVSGVGYIQVTPLANSLANARKTTRAVPLSLDPTFDLGLPLNTGAERCAFRIFSTPLEGTTDNSFSLQHLVCRISPHPWSGDRGSNQ